MKTARQLLEAYLIAIQTTDEVGKLFAEDGALELPYLKSLGQSGRTEGPENISKMWAGLKKAAPGFEFIDIKILIETPDQVFGEYSADTMWGDTRYQQTYMGRLVAENGKIKLLREGMNLYPVMKQMGLIKS